MTAEKAPGGPASLYREQALHHYEQWGFEHAARVRGQATSPGFLRILSLYAVCLVCLAVAGLVFADVRVSVTGSVPALLSPDRRDGVVRIVAVFPRSAADRVRAGTRLELNLGADKAAVKWSATVSGNGVAMGRNAVVASYPALSRADIPDEAVLGLGALPAVALSRTTTARVVSARGLAGEQPIWNLPGLGGAAE